MRLFFWIGIVICAMVAIGGTAFLVWDTIYRPLRTKYLQWRHRNAKAFPMPEESSSERRANWWKRGEPFPEYRVTEDDLNDDSKE